MQLSRYDEHAAWFGEYTQGWTAAVTEALPARLDGLRVLDLASGWGQVSRLLADRGGEVTAVELSVPLVERARAVGGDHQTPIDYRHGDAAGVQWWDKEAFDAVVCNMALMDIDDLAGALTTIRTVLRRDGWFLVSLLHPCFPGASSAGGDALPSWPPDRGYSAEGWWTTGSTGVRGHVGANHRRLSTYLNTMLDAGLTLTRFIEPAAQLPRVLIIEGGQIGSIEDGADRK